MKASHGSPLAGKAVALTLLLSFCLAAVSLLMACEEEEEALTPVATPAAATPAAGTPETGITEMEILLGAHCPLSGPLGAAYRMIPEATRAYFDYVNDTQGGVCGRKIVYKVVDNREDPAVAAGVVRKLLEEEGVFAFVGNLGDLPHSGAWDHLNEKGVPDILVSAGSHKYGADPQGHPWTVQMIPDYTMEGTSFGQYISQNLAGGKVAILYENDDFGIDGMTGVKQGLDTTKNELVSVQVYESTDVSVRSQVINMKAVGAEVVVLYTTPAFTAQAVREADRQGWHPQWLMSYVNSDPITFQFVDPKLMEGAITFQSYLMADWTEEPAVAEHYEIMGKYGGPAPTNFTLYGQSIAEVAVEALSRACDNLTRQGLMDAIHSIKDWHSDLLVEGVTITFSETDHTALQTGRMLKVVIKDGRGQWEYFGPMYSFE